MWIEFLSKSKLKYHERMQHEVLCDICESACGCDCLEVFMPSRQDMQEYDSIRDRQLEYIESLEWQPDNVCEKLG